MADEVKDTAKAEAKHSNTTDKNKGGADLGSKSKQVENDTPKEETLKDVRDTEGVENDKDKVSGQNHPSAVPADERDFSEQAAALARAAEAEWTADEQKAGEDYLYPDNYVSAQNPPKNVVIAYKSQPTGEANNS